MNTKKAVKALESLIAEVEDLQEMNRELQAELADAYEEIEGQTPAPIFDRFAEEGRKAVWNTAMNGWHARVDVRSDEDGDVHPESLDSYLGHIRPELPDWMSRAEFLEEFSADILKHYRDEVRRDLEAAGMENDIEY